jgi:hypothetical protein
LQIIESSVDVNSHEPKSPADNQTPAGEHDTAEPRTVNARLDHKIHEVIHYNDKYLKTKVIRWLETLPVAPSQQTNLATKSQEQHPNDRAATGEHLTDIEAEVINMLGEGLESNPMAAPETQSGLEKLSLSTTTLVQLPTTPEQVLSEMEEDEIMKLIEELPVDTGPVCDDRGGGDLNVG